MPASRYPGAASTAPVWAPPRSLAATGGITVVFSSCGYLDVSVPRVSLPYRGCRAFTPGGLPHSEIPGSKATGAYPGRFAACRVLRRPREPRHPPRALPWSGAQDTVLIFCYFLVSSSRPSMSKNSDPAPLRGRRRGKYLVARRGKGTRPVKTRKKAGGAARLQKGGVPAAPSGTATLLRLSPSHRCRPSPLLAVTVFRRPRLPWLDGRCVQGPGTYSPRHG